MALVSRLRTMRPYNQNRSSYKIYFIFMSSFLLGQISGGHFNASWIQRRKTSKLAFIHWIQIQKWQFTLFQHGTPCTLWSANNIPDPSLWYKLGYKYNHVIKPNYLWSLIGFDGPPFIYFVLPSVSRSMSQLIAALKAKEISVPTWRRWEGRSKGQRAEPAVSATHNSVLYGFLFTFPSGSAKLLPVVSRVELACAAQAFWRYYFDCWPSSSPRGDHFLTCCLILKRQTQP